MTREQHVRGADADVDRGLMLTGYDVQALSESVRDTLDAAQFAKCGVSNVETGVFRYDYSLVREEIVASPS